ncbi:MAG: divalent-cation tolerance protein CutA [Myxococcota bacterium]|nr:divalent-cation tolerance protein CutA [Myxococcota bacterium]MEC8425790.1 divalent-cation tolerance protein CutA [Myxococcota bacterium]
MSQSTADEPVVAVLVTAPSEDVAAALARGAVSAGVAACGNLVPGVRSIYRWQGEVHDDAEVLIVFKTARSRFEALRRYVVDAHPYETPEVIALPVTDGHAPYLAWVAANVGVSR